MNIAAAEKIMEYADEQHIFTDGSRTTEGKTGYSVFIPDQNHAEHKRLPDGTNILTCELVAIRQALHWLLPSNIQNAVIFSDSINALHNIELNSSKLCENLVLDIIEKCNELGKEHRRITMVWIPSHVGIEPNEEADRLAKLSTMATQTELEILSEIAESKTLISSFIDTKWQQNWDMKNHQLKRICPKVSRTNQFGHPSRAIEVKISRLRLAKCGLNKYLQDIKRHQTGLCDYCGEPEDIQHFLIDCRNQNSLSIKLKSRCRSTGTPATLENILTKEIFHEIIGNFKERRI